MYPASLLLCLSLVHQALLSCYVTQISSVRREVLNVVPQTTLPGCQNECDRETKCEATVLNAASTHCVLLGNQIADSSSNACPAPFTAQVKTMCGTTLSPTTISPVSTSTTSAGSTSASSEATSSTPSGGTSTATTTTITTDADSTTTAATTTTAASTSTATGDASTATTTSTAGTTTTTGTAQNDPEHQDIPVRVKGPIDDYYTVGECSRESDIVGSPVEGGTPPCGTPPLSQRRIVIDAIQADGTHMVLENNLYSSIKWDSAKKSWYFEIEATDTTNKVYFYTAKCVLPPVTALAPKCECAALNTESAYPGNYNPVSVKIDKDPCCTKDYVQMNCVRAYSTATTYSSDDRLISCTMGEWLMLRTGSSHYNSYLIRAAACVD